MRRLVPDALPRLMGLTNSRFAEVFAEVRRKVRFPEKKLAVSQVAVVAWAVGRSVPNPTLISGPVTPMAGPTAAKPPVKASLTCPASVPSGRKKSAEVSSMD